MAGLGHEQQSGVADGLRRLLKDHPGDLCLLRGEVEVPQVAESQPAGVRLRPIVFRPTFHKFGGQACGGVQLHVTDAAAFRRASSVVSAQWTIVKVAARSFTNFPAGFASRRPAR